MLTIDDFYKNHSLMVKYRPDISIYKIATLNVESKGHRLSGTAKVLKDSLSPSSKILDIGAGTKSLKQFLESIGFCGIYKSMDIDKNDKYDYYSIDDIDEKFDNVFLFNLLEHLPFETGLRYLNKAFKVLNNNGKLFICVPNIYHINHMWKSDITHIKTYPFQDLYAITRMIGFNGGIKIFRIYGRPFNCGIKRFLLDKAKRLLLRIIDADFTEDIWLIAEKN